MVPEALESDLSRMPRLEDLLSDEEHRAQFFPVVRSKVYLAHAAVSPLPTPVVEAVSAYARAAGSEGQFERLHERHEQETRQMAARQIGVEPDEIALVPSTSAGLSMVAQGIDWRPGDSVVAFGADFPANIYPWLNLERRGVALRLIPSNPAGTVTTNDVLAHLDSSTRLVSLSTVHYCTGALLPVESIAAELKARGILFCLDAIQSIGALPISMRCVDFAVADAHKWLLGPQGIALMYVRRELFDVLWPALVGWKSVEDNRDYTSLRLCLANSARRYEPGSLNILGMVGLHAALRLFEEFGIETVSERLRTLRRQLDCALRSRGYEILGPSDAEATGPILSFRGRLAADRLAKQLLSRDCIVSKRRDPEGNWSLRLSPHCYNTDAEIQRFLDHLDQAERSSHDG